MDNNIDMNNSSVSLADRGRWGWLVLFTSSATLICCALPILLVTLGLGAVSASLFSALPFLVSVAQYKIFIFIGSGLLLVAGGWSVFRSNRHCPIDPTLAEQCNRAHRFNRRVLVLSSLIWLLGFTAAYLAIPIWMLMS